MKVIVLRHRRVSQVSLGAEGGSNALSIGNGRALQNFSDFVDTYSARGFGMLREYYESAYTTAFVDCKRAAKRCSYAPGSVGAFIQIPKAMHKRVDTRGGLDSGSRTKSKR